MRALVVSRTPGARAWIRSALGTGWTCDEAAEGLEALRIARTEAPDLVVADSSTEPFGAFGLARELKILPETPAILIVLDRAQDDWLAKWSGADAWLVQPVDAFELARVAGGLVREPAPEPAE